MVPRTLTSQSRSGRAAETRMSICAPRWKRGRERLLHGSRIACVALHDLRARVHVLASSRREVVEDDDVVAADDERVDEVGADEPGSACHDRPHGALS
jgi:hypothetical protein